MAKTIVGIIGDTHEPFTHKQYLDFCYDTFNKHKVNRLIHIGDECFPGDVQILTPTGWIRLDEYSNESVLQYNPDGTSEFVIPSRFVNKEYEGKIYHFNRQGFSSKTTPLHNLVLSDKSGNLKKYPAETAPKHKIVPRTCTLEANSVSWTDDELRLQVALSADASFTTGYLRISFKKQRKITRFESLLGSLNIKYTKSNPPGRVDYTSFYIHAQPGLEKYSKRFDMSWIGSLSLSQREVVMSELEHWDGHKDKSRKRVVYSTVLPHNAEFIQTIAHTSGYKATITKTINKISTTHRVNIYHEPDATRLGNPTLKHYSGNVYCVTVPSGMILTRQDEHISISGNCDNHALSYHEHSPDGYGAGHEAEQAQKNMEKWYKSFPRVDVMVGNHSALPFRQATTAGIPKRFLRAYEEIWHAPGGWKWHTELEVDHVKYIHGIGSSGQNGAINRALRSRQSTVIGHLHAFGGVNYHASENDLIFGLNVGCGIDIHAYAFEYGKPFVNKPTLGCGIVIDGHLAQFIPMNLGKKYEWIK